MPGVVEAPSVIMAGVFELEMDGHSGPGGGHIPTGALGSASLAAEGASNGADLEVEVDEENISKDAMAVDMREMKEPDMQKLNQVRRAWRIAQMHNTQLLLPKLVYYY